jgi:hypothetical protein
MADCTVKEAEKEMRMSRWWFYRLPPDTPGIYRYGRALRIDVQQLREWMKTRTQNQLENLTEHQTAGDPDR